MMDDMRLPRYRLKWIFIGIAACAVVMYLFRPQPKKQPDIVTVTCTPIYYAINAIKFAGEGDQTTRLLPKADEKLMWEVDGIVLEVAEPKECKGKILTMHHDSVLASGNPFKLFETGKWYQFEVYRNGLGKFDFGPCSVGFKRTIVQKPKSASVRSTFAD